MKKKIKFVFCLFSKERDGVKMN